MRLADMLRVPKRFYADLAERTRRVEAALDNNMVATSSFRASARGDGRLEALLAEVLLIKEQP